MKRTRELTHGSPNDSPNDSPNGSPNEPDTAHRQKKWRPDSPYPTFGSVNPSEQHNAPHWSTMPDLNIGKILISFTDLLEAKPPAVPAAAPATGEVEDNAGEGAEPGAAEAEAAEALMWPARSLTPTKVENVVTPTWQVKSLQEALKDLAEDDN